MGGVLLLALIGAVAGLIAVKVMKINASLLEAVGIGILGAIIGTAVIRILMGAFAGVAMILIAVGVAVAGACLLIWLYQKYLRK